MKGACDPCLVHTCGRGRWGPALNLLGLAAGARQPAQGIGLCLLSREPEEARFALKPQPPRRLAVLSGHPTGRRDHLPAPAPKLPPSPPPAAACGSARVCFLPPALLLEISPYQSLLLAVKRLELWPGRWKSHTGLPAALPGPECWLQKEKRATTQDKWDHPFLLLTATVGPQLTSLSSSCRVFFY